MSNVQTGEAFSLTNNQGEWLRAIANADGEVVIETGSEFAEGPCTVGPDVLPALRGYLTRVSIGLDADDFHAACDTWAEAEKMVARLSTYTSDDPEVVAKLEEAINVANDAYAAVRTFFTPEG